MHLTASIVNAIVESEGVYEHPLHSPCRREELAVVKARGAWEKFVLSTGEWMDDVVKI